MKDTMFMEQMCENVKYNLTYPYHINFDKYLGNEYHNKDYPNSFHKHNFEDVLKVAYMEPYALYLTDEDKKYYSEQELEFIKKVQEDESKKLDAGMVLVSLDLNEETIAMLEAYKLEKNMTFEEAVIDILKEMIKNKEELKKTIETEKTE